MRKDELKTFAQKLGQLENDYRVEVCSDNYYTRAVIIDTKKEDGFSYHYEHGRIELDTNTHLVGEDE